MPKALIAVILIVASLSGAHAAVPNAHVCDQAARRAAQALNVPLDVLRAISRVETGRARDGQLEPWPWTINVEGRGYWFASEAEAKAYVFDIFKGGARSFDVGCFQINYRWHGKAFRSIDAMFDPYENASYAAQFLSDLYGELGSWPAAAGAYHSRTPSLAQAYRDRFQTTLAQLDDPAFPTSDPFAGAVSPLIPLAQGRVQQGALGSLMPASGPATAFIAFN